MKTQTLTIKINFNPENYQAPSAWDLEGIFDLEPGESVEIIEASTITEAQQ
jgi:hypothetical protein